ncbi:hypothetical protein J5N97_023993 [Dioscorea zingiberensis]|uniref:Glycosyltransferase n=1 Tax=Dioscorea zingiberensis TaxID=325984 RepID=A0A9D5C5L8_9LILI|nr:hypothetical protein J5N97_023993 [Dioscorea zingiberensis]
MLRLAGALQARGFKPIVAVPDFIHRSYRDHRVIVEPIPSGFRDDDPKDFFSIDASMEKIMPANLERILLDCGGGLACVVVDLLASWAIDVAARCGVPVAGFWPAMFATYRLFSAIPELMLNGFISECGKPIHHDQHQDDYKDEQDMLMISNQARLSTKELPWLVGEASAQKSRFAFWLRVINRSKSLPWILINSFPKEDDILTLLSTHHHPQIIHLAPVLLAMDTKRRNKREDEDDDDDESSCIEWLKKQEPCTVIYISFGTWVGPIGEEKITELAMALEETKRPFLWVLKEEQQWRAGLPEGYLERVAGKGKVVAWAPQEEVLKSEAVGCYITHCGWNSTMEAIRHEKRLLCYPISGDQFVNCSYIVGVWGIGIKLEGLERGVVLDGVERIMGGREGEMVKKRVGEMKVRAMGDEGICGAAANLQSFVQAVRRGKFG